MQTVSDNSAPKMEYSFSGSRGLFVRKCSPYVIAPPATAAKIIQPLWRKNAASGFAPDTDGDSVLTANIHHWIQRPRFRSRQFAQIFPQQIPAAFERRQRDPFIRRVSL